MTLAASWRARTTTALPPQLSTHRSTSARPESRKRNAGLKGPMKAQDAPSRRLLEAALAIVLPFDCYLFDDAAQLPPPLFGRCVAAAGQRQAGIIFATNQPGVPE